jgi:hypothetical protein
MIPKSGLRSTIHSNPVKRTTPCPPNAKRGAEAPRFVHCLRYSQRQLAAAVEVSRCRFMTILFSAPR